MPNLVILELMWLYAEIGVNKGESSTRTPTRIKPILADGHLILRLGCF
jgi:hypothetical protein